MQADMDRFVDDVEDNLDSFLSYDDASKGKLKVLIFNLL